MSKLIPETGRHVVIAKSSLDHLFQSLRQSGYRLVGPTLGEKAVQYDELRGVADLPIGWGEKQSPGSYQLMQRDDGRYFGYTTSPHSFKKFLYPPSLTLFRTGQDDRGFVVESDQEVPQYALVGVRPCEMAAITVLDRVFLGATGKEPDYESRRQKAFILAVNCTEPGQTCFCQSLNTGPSHRNGFDLAMTELDDQFLLDVGSELGASMLAQCDWELAGAFALDHARRLMEHAETAMGRSLRTHDLPATLFANLEHPQWEAIAKRCLSCMNCTMVCPTCFCADVQDISDLTGAHSERVRLWDSCFNPDFSYVHGGNLRPSTRSRYRQWLTHKLASWPEQFGTLGCVGCGRCITWCPVGIDLTVEVAAIQGESLP